MDYAYNTDTLYIGTSAIENAAGGSTILDLQRRRADGGVSVGHGGLSAVTEISSITEGYVGNSGVYVLEVSDDPTGTGISNPASWAIAPCPLTYSPVSLPDIQV